MEQLKAFIEAAKAQGASDEFVVAMLRERGWPAKEIYAILGERYAQAAGVALPEPPSRLESAREAFFHLLAFATLATWVFATGSIWFELIQSWFPDPAMDRGNEVWTIRRISWQMASVIVAFPAFVWATRNILRDLTQNPDKAESAVRRWLTNVALLLTALVFIGDLVSFVSAVLQGELTVRFVLKSLTVLVLAGAVFLYYSRGLGKSSLVPPQAWHRMFAAGAAALTALSIGLGFWLNGSPSVLRLYAEDSRRVRDLYSIALEMQSKVEPLAAPVGDRTDPFTGQPYEFRLLGGTRYELCAQFRAASPANRQGYPADSWQHPQGRHCFSLDTRQPAPYPAAATYF